MVRKLSIAIAAVTTLALTASVALAAITFHQGPSFTDEGGGYTARLFAEASGLGNQDLHGRIAFSGVVQYTCQNKGGNTAPGQPLQVQSQADQQAKAETKNGRATIDLTASFTPPATVPGNLIGCPNGNWTGINPVVLGPVSATGTIRHGNPNTGTLIYGPVTLNNLTP
jgi:hypothetical protein